MGTKVEVDVDELRIIVALATYATAQFGDEHFDSFWTGKPDGLGLIRGIPEEQLSERKMQVLVEMFTRHVNDAMQSSVKKTAQDNALTRPSHYGGEANPFEPIKIIEYYDLGFHLGNTLKYILRAGKKATEAEVKDLEKAAWYLNRKVDKLKGAT